MSTMRYDFYVRTKQDLIDAVLECGIVPYFSSSIPGFSLEEHCHPGMLFNDSENNSWFWKGPVIQETGCAYGKFFGKKAAYVRRDLFLDLANYRRDGYDFDARYRGLGSIDIAAIARSVLMISRDEANPAVRYMFPIKSSLAPEGPAIAFSFKMNGGIEWQGRYELNTAELLDSITVKTSKADKARSKMKQMLEHQDCATKEVLSAMAEIGVGQRTVEKIKKEMQIRAYRSGGSWYWGLPKNE